MALVQGHGHLECRRREAQNLGELLVAELSRFVSAATDIAEIAFAYPLQQQFAHAAGECWRESPTLAQPGVAAVVI